jgi:hypothetical protein
MDTDTIVHYNKQASLLHYQILTAMHDKYNYGNLPENIRKSFKSELLILNYDNRLWTHSQSNNETRSQYPISYHMHQRWTDNVL